jgi:hypothetical protein
MLQKVLILSLQVHVFLVEDSLHSLVVSPLFPFVFPQGIPVTSKRRSVDLITAVPPQAGLSLVMKGGHCEWIIGVEVVTRVIID